jgi:hypothetical protein
LEATPRVKGGVLLDTGIGTPLAATSEEEVSAMAACEVCGNEYDKTLEITREGATHGFDSFECAIHALAPTCAHCGCKVIGHGVEAGDTMYCCAHCAREEGVTGAQDRA